MRGYLSSLAALASGHDPTAVGIPLRPRPRSLFEPEDTASSGIESTFTEDRLVEDTLDTYVLQSKFEWPVPDSQQDLAPHRKADTDTNAAQPRPPARPASNDPVESNARAARPESVVASDIQAKSSENSISAPTPAAESATTVGASETNSQLRDGNNTRTPNPPSEEARGPRPHSTNSPSPVETAQANTPEPHNESLSLPVPKDMPQQRSRAAVEMRPEPARISIGRIEVTVKVPPTPPVRTQRTQPSVPRAASPSQAREGFAAYTAVRRGRLR
jgi:hypothetical protein